VKRGGTTIAEETADPDGRIGFSDAVGTSSVSYSVVP
jgi:hypothetical protein